MDPVRSDVKAFVDALRRAGVRVTREEVPRAHARRPQLHRLFQDRDTALQDVGELIRAEFAR